MVEDDKKYEKLDMALCSPPYFRTFGFLDASAGKPPLTTDKFYMEGYNLFFGKQRGYCDFDDESREKAR